MRRLFPSLSGLVAFEATARHLSFTRAARELNLTQSAISHQIRHLEDMLGAPLFHRGGQALRLTRIGHDYLPAVREALDGLQSATGRIRNAAREDELVVTTLVTFATTCLMPRLPEFQRSHPQIRLRLNAVSSFEGFATRDYDVAIRYGSGDWPGYTAEKLSEEEIFPVASPALLPRGRKRLKPEELPRLTRVRTAFYFLYRDDWPLWLEAAGMPADTEFAGEITCDLALTTLQAALDGVGVAMGRTPLVDRDIAAGRLVAVAGPRIRSTSAYYLSSPLERAASERAAAFRAWAREAFAHG